MEEWREVPGFPGYMASSEGRIARLLSLQKQERNGYARYRVTVRRACHSFVRSVHTLVLLAFKGAPPPGKPDGCHGDGNALNNQIENLRWGSKLENHEDTKRHGTFKLPPKSRGVTAHIGKIERIDPAEIAAAYLSGEPCKSIASRYSVVPGTVNRILRSAGVSPKAHRAEQTEFRRLRRLKGKATGERQGNSRLVEVDIERARDMHRAGCSSPEIGKFLGIQDSHVRAIASRRLWSHVP